MGYPLFIRCLSVLLLLIALGACSRSYDVTIPPTQVKPDVDCTFAEFSAPVILDLDLVQKGEDQRVAVNLLKLQNIPSDDQFADVNLVRLSNGIDVTSTMVPIDTTVSLEDGTSAVISKLSVNIDTLSGDDPIDLENGQEEHVDLYSATSAITTVDINVSVELTVTELRKGCELLGETVEDEGAEKVVRTIVKEFTITVSLTKSEVMDSLSHAVYEGASNALNALGTSVTSNGRFIAVGVPGDDGGDTSFIPSGANLSNLSFSDSGAVQLYERDLDAGVLRYCGVLKASNARAGDAFGSRVLLRGENLYVSALGEDSSFSGVTTEAASGLVLDYSKTDSGAVYEYRIDSCSSVTETAYFKSPDNADNLVVTASGFGSALAEYDGQLFIGAPRQTLPNSTTEVGRAYQFFKEDGAWLPQSKIYAHLLEHSGQRFGASISVSEGYVLIGVPMDSSDSADLPVYNGVVAPTYLSSNSVTENSPHSGAAVLFVRAGGLGVASALAYLKPDESDQGDQFGSAVAISGNRLFVSAPLEDSASAVWNVNAVQNKAPLNGSPLDGNYGAVYQYDIDEESNASFSNYIKSRQPIENGNFGRVLAADQRYLIVGQHGLKATVEGLEVDAHVAVQDHIIADDPVYLSIVDEGTAIALSESVDALDFYAGNLVLGIPTAELAGKVQAGAFSIWD